MTDIGKEFVEKIQELVERGLSIKDNIGREYISPNYKAISPPRPDTMHMSTLSSLVNYISQVHGEKKPGCFLHVVGPSHVDFVGPVADMLLYRDVYASAAITLTPFKTGIWHDVENFIIGLQQYFVPTARRDELLALVSTIEAGVIQVSEDDGISQIATVKKGITKVGNAKIPNPITLQPYRTFPEIDQPSVSYILRIQGTGNVQCSLYAEEDPRWRLNCVLEIQNYLLKQDLGIPVVV